MRVAVVVVLIGCADQRATPDAATAVDAQVRSPCQERLHCHDGVVTPRCAEGMHACTSGCDVESSSYAGGDVPPETFCAETPAKRVGDPCPCLPTRADDQGDGTVVQTYLACQGGVCVAAAAPVSDVWLQGCVVPAPTGFRGVVRLPAGWCLVDNTEPCFARGRTWDCAGDWECPEGASCDDAVEGAYGTGICRPGPRGAPISLGC